MSGPIVRLGADQFDAAMGFLNRCFGEREPMDFEKMLPSIYRRDDGVMQSQYAILEDGEISAIVGLFPLKLAVGDVTLRLAGIGGVSSAPERRGRGLMSHLVGHVRDEVVRQGYDLSYLGGARQRYRRFGWEVAGTQVRVVLGKTARAAAPSGDLVFDQAPGDPATLSTVQELHDTREIHCVRDREAFSRYLTCWYRTWWTTREGNRVVGYLVADKNGAYVPEMVAEDEEMLVRMAVQWSARIDAPVAFVLPALPLTSLTALSEIADSIELKPSGNWQVFNWPKVLDAFLRQRQRTLPLLPGELVVGLTDGQRLHIDVRVGSAGCSSRPDLQADLTCEPRRLVRAVFGPGPASLALGAVSKVEMLDAWGPLPLAISAQDHV